MDPMGSAGLRSKRFLGFQRADGAKSLVPTGRLRYCISSHCWDLAMTCQVQIDQEMEVSLLLGAQLRYPDF